MCGQFGLVHAMLYIFSYGYKSARLFGRNLSVWDFFLKVTMDFNQSLPHLYQTSSNSNQNSPHPSPRRGHYTLESPKRSIGQGLSMSSLLDSPKRTFGAGGLGSNIPQGATLSRSNQFRRYDFWPREIALVVLGITFCCPWIFQDKKLVPWCQLLGINDSCFKSLAQNAYFGAQWSLRGLRTDKVSFRLPYVFVWVSLQWNQNNCKQYETIFLLYSAVRLETESSGYPCSKSCKKKKIPRIFLARLEKALNLLIFSVTFVPLL